MTGAARSTVEPSAQGFHAEGSHWICTGPLTMAMSAAALRQSEALALPASGTVDFSRLREADSSALAVLLALLRRADRESKALRFQGLPAVLRTLAHVYGIDALLFSDSSPEISVSATAVSA